MPDQEWDWHNRYERNTVRPEPATHDIDHNWRLLKSLVNPDGGFNGGIDLVDNKVNGELAVRKRLCAHPSIADHDSVRWRREMLVIRKLSHPNIPYYIDGFFTSRKGSLYMQPCRLGSVAKWLDTERKDYLSPAMQEYLLWHILHQVAEAILYMQTGFQNLADANRSTRDRARGWIVLVHGDIRPDQIFLNNPPNGPVVSALLGDFGFAQFIKPWHRTEVHDGPGCESSSKAPEFPCEISEATDIFGLGATAQLYLNQRERPLAGLRRGYLTRFRISDELDDLICSCLAVRAFHRPTIREVLEQLEWGLAQQRAEGLSLSLLNGPLFDVLWPRKRN